MLIGYVAAQCLPVDATCSSDAQCCSNKCNGGKCKSSGSGAIWTTKIDCGADTQDVNHFAIGDDVHINGDGFTASTSYDWTITGQPGGASCDPDAVVASGTKITDATGKFCIHAYTVQEGDCGEYQVKFDVKGDNYRVDITTEPPTTVPETALSVGLIALLTPGMIYMIRKKRE